MMYLDVLADEIRAAVPRDALPAETASDLFRLYAVLLLAKGEAITRHDVHNAWVAWMATKGEAHESLVPYSELARDTKEEDSPFVTAIRTVARRHRLGP